MYFSVGFENDKGGYELSSPLNFKGCIPPKEITAITLTILSTVLGLVPFVWGGQSEIFWFAFAAGAMGGLLFSLLAILLYLPLFLKMR